MPYLRELHISNMPNLTFISSGAMSKLVSLQEVYIGHNHHLSDISPDAFSSRKDNEESEQWPPIVKVSVTWYILKY
jgi:hypothetical protein